MAYKVMNMKLQTVMVLYSILMLGCSAPYEENSHSHPKRDEKALTIEEIAQVKASCLKTLHKVTSRDDLIGQMFETVNGSLNLTPLGIHSAIRI